MINWLVLFLVPFLIALGVMFWFKKKVTLVEFLIQIGISALFVLAALGIAYMGSTLDTEIWNGQVTGKERKEVSCSHSYDCNCYYTEDCSGSGSSRSCSMVRHCQTCYEHSFDVDWDAMSSTNERVSIDRVDRQGLKMPPRWGKVYVGEPWSSSHLFTNYILANPGNVLLGSRGDQKQFGKWVPKYPDTVYDYYKHDPVLNMGVPNVDVGVWNWLIREVNKQLGPRKQVNVIVILVPTSDRAYMLALKDAWLGGKKNDVDVVIGSVDGHKIDFVDVMSWTPNGDYKADLVGKITDIGTLDARDEIQKAIFEKTDHEFVRMHMKDMKYLVRSFQPSRRSMWTILILSILLSVGMAVVAVKNELTDDSLKEEV